MSKASGSGVSYQSSYNRSTDKLQAMGEVAHTEQPFQSPKFQDDDSLGTPSEATRLLGSINDGNKEESKKQLYKWMWKMALVAVIIIVLITVGALVIVLVPGQKGNLQTGCVKKYNEEVDYFPDKIEKLDEGLVTEYYPHYKVSSCSVATDQYLLYQCGTPLPNGFFRSKKFSIPLQNIATSGSSFLGYLELLGALDRVRYLGGYESVVSPCIRGLVEQGTLELYSTNREIRDVQTNQSDAVFWSLKIQDELNDKNIYILPHLETSFRKRASIWMQFIGMFFNMEKDANQIAKGITQRYDCHKSNAQTFETRPKVAWISYSTPFWYILKEADKQEIIGDAGGFLLNNTADSFLRYEEFHQNLFDVDIVIDQSSLTTTWELFLDKYKFDSTNETFPFIEKQQVWRSDKVRNQRGDSDWDESAYAEPDVILEDLISIIHPEYDSERERVWFRNIVNNKEESTIPEISDCHSRDYYDPKPARGTRCSLS